MQVIGIIWQFNTARFHVVFEALEEIEMDLSFDEDGSTYRAILNNELQVFMVRGRLMMGEATIAEDYIGQCIHANIEDFIDHRGINSQPGAGSYFSDMVYGLVASAREHFATLPKLRDTHRGNNVT